MSELPTGSSAATGELSALVVPLLRGVLYQETEPKQWSHLLNLQARVRDYVAVLGLELVLDEAESYAYLQSRQVDEADGAPGEQIPRLVPRRPLSFQVSLLLALLRKKLLEFDSVGGGTRLVLSRDEVVELVRVFLPETSNEARLTEQIETQLNKIAEMGFVRRLKGEATGSGNSGAGQPAMYEVRRILKAFVDAQWLAEFDTRLAAYQAHLASSAGALGKAAAGDGDHE
jgi:hypothetical protein